VRLSDSERRLISARRLDGTAGLTGVVSRFLLDVARHSEDLPAEQSERVLAHASDLVVTLLSDRLGASTRVRGVIQRLVLLRIKDYIHQRLCDPALGPAEIAAAGLRPQPQRAPQRVSQRGRIRDVQARRSRARLDDPSNAQ
jgi:hypothetical protein